MSALLALIKALPELLALIKILQKAAAEAEIDFKAKESISAIHKAVAAKDMASLDAVFSGKPVSK